MSELLAQSLSLPCGARLRNRLAKAAMTEGLADPAGRPTAELDGCTGYGAMAARDCCYPAISLLMATT